MCTDAEINDRVSAICSRFTPSFIPVFIQDVDEAIEYIRYELPEFQLIHLSDDAFDVDRLVAELTDDTWLHYGGIIGVYSRRDARRVEQLPRETNIVTMIRRAEFVETFFRVLYIIQRNRQILFQRDIQLDFLGSVTGSFEMDNDPYNARTYASLIANFLFNANYVDLDMRDRVHVALFELIMNAIEHGNCGITYEEKNAWLEETGDVLPLIRRKCQDPRIAARRVSVTYSIGREESTFRIADEGSGFDWRSRLDDESVSLDLHGHGIKMTKYFVSGLRYNDAGNVVEFDVKHERTANARPGLFEGQETLDLVDGTTVFREGEESNDLFYIVSGQYDVIAGESRVATLTADDMFLGEMSFLLGNRRSASVVAREAGQLVRVTKNAFVAGIQRQPYYGIFLARLLAHRLTRANQRIASRAG